MSTEWRGLNHQIWQPTDDLKTVCYELKLWIEYELALSNAYIVEWLYSILESNVALYVNCTSIKKRI